MILFITPLIFAIASYFAIAPFFAIASFLAITPFFANTFFLLKGPNPKYQNNNINNNQMSENFILEF